MIVKKLSLMVLALATAASTQAKPNPLSKLGVTPKKTNRVKTPEEALALAKSLAYNISLNNKEVKKMPLAKTTALQSRVIAYAYRNLTTSVLMDTAKLYYGSPERGTDIKKEIAKYDSLIGWTYDDPSLVYDYRSKQTFDAANNITSTTDEGWDDVSGSFQFESKINYTYNAAKNVATQIVMNWDGSAWVNESKIVSVYDAKQNKTADSSFEWSGSAWQVNFVERSYYNSKNNVDSFKFYFNMMGSLIEMSRVVNTYDASGYLTISKIKSLDFSDMTLKDNTRFTYTNNAAGFATEELEDSWNETSSSWDKIAKTSYTYDAANNILTEINATWNTSSSSYVNDRRTSYTYNKYNQPLTEVSSEWITSGSTWDKLDSTTYYYEEHTTSIKESARQAVANVYPVPANSELNISADITQAQQLNIVLADIQGRIVLNQQLEERSSLLNERISVAQLPSGQYILNIRGDKGFQATQKVSVVH